MTDASSNSVIRFRPATEADREFIAAMFHETDTWGDPQREVSEHFQDDLVRYVDMWSAEQGGVIAERDTESDSQPIGAAWSREFTAEEPGSGFVADEYPEIAIALAPGHTGKGLGRSLLQAMVDQARAAGRPGVSLAVEDGNDRAAAVYQKLGFSPVGRDVDDRCTVMLLRF